MLYYNFYPESSFGIFYFFVLLNPFATAAIHCIMPGFFSRKWIGKGRRFPCIAKGEPSMGLKPQLSCVIFFFFFFGLINEFKERLSKEIYVASKSRILIMFVLGSGWFIHIDEKTKYLHQPNQLIY